MSYHPRLKQVIIEGFEDFFKTRFDDTMTHREGMDIDRNGCYSSRIRIKGDHVDAYLMVFATREALTHCYPERKYGDKILEEDILDWVGEIVNRVLGNMKPKLQEFNVHTNLQAPQTQNSPYPRAEEIHAEPETMVFSNDTYQIAVTIVGSCFPDNLAKNFIADRLSGFQCATPLTGWTGLAQRILK